MVLFLDTCFWSHCLQLYTAQIWDIRPILLQFRLGSTQEVMKEISYYHLDSFVPVDRILLVSIADNDYETYHQYLPPLDRANQSLLIAMRKMAYEDPVVLTDDGELLAEVLQTGLHGMKLPVFVLWLILNAMIEKKIGAKCIRFWEKHGLYRKKTLNRLKQELRTIS